MTLLFTSTHEAPFVIEDLHTLRRHYEVHHLLTRSPAAPLQILRHIWKSDLTFTWFASAYAAAVVCAANLSGKRSIVVIGGADVARVDAAAYGQWRNPWKALLAGYVLRRAWRVLAVDESLRREAIRRADYGGENITVVPTGYDPARWHPGAIPRRGVLTVAGCESPSRLKVKGIPVLLEAARLLPGTPFTIVGISQEILWRSGLVDIPHNVRILPPGGQEALLPLYQEAKVYCQPSLFEGLPNSLCEAMLCGCIPVATHVGGSPGVIGETGVLVAPGDPDNLVEALSRAERMSTGAEARARVIDRFPPGRRVEQLINLIGPANE